MSNSGEFKERLAFGQVAESQIEAWLIRRCNFAILPVYEGGRENKGPRFQTPKGAFILPDILAVRGQEVRWIEVKRKSRFSWYRVGGYWTTGIDKHHYAQYLQVSQMTSWPVYLLFLHSEKYSAGRQCPTGLFGGELKALTARIDHTSDRWGRGGMVYWRHETLTRFATLEEVSRASVQTTWRAGAVPPAPQPRLN